MLSQNISIFHKLKNFISYIFIKFPKISAFFLGCLMKFCFCKGSTYPILLFFIFPLLFVILQKSIKKQSFFIGFSFGMGYFSSTLYWIAESFKCVGFGNYGYLAVALLVLYLSIYPGLTCYFTKKFATTRISFILLFSTFWTISEILRGIIFTGFPWNLIGYIAYDIPYFSQIADIFGVYGVSFLLILIIGLISFRKTIIYGIIILFFNILYGYYKINLYNGYITPESETDITIVQPSISQENKLCIEKFKENIDLHIKLSKVQNHLYTGSRLIIWPEAAINMPISSKGELLKYITSQITQNNTYIISGCDRFDKNMKLYNSLVVLGKNGEIKKIYDKRHLLPFGEFIPECLLNLGIKKLTAGITNFSKGKLKRTIKLNNISYFDCVICYEMAFPGEIIDNHESKWILNITNDAWFNNSDGPTQHLKIACFRAIEEGKMIIRCANNGISSIINCNGKLIKTLKTNEINSIDYKVPGKYHNTIFSIYKNNIILILITILLFLFFCKKKSKIKIF